MPAARTRQVEIAARSHEPHRIAFYLYDLAGAFHSLYNQGRDEPALRVWMQDSVPPTTSYVERPGRWVAEHTWPSPDIEWRRFELSRHHLEPAGTRVEAGEIPIRSPLTVGLFAGKLDYRDLKFPQMVFVMLLFPQKPRDYRDWDQIRNWGAEFRSTYLEDQKQQKERS